MSACIGNELQSSNQTTVIRVKIIHLFNIPMYISDQTTDLTRYKE